MGMKDFMLKQLMKSQVKKLPADQQAMAMKMADEHPELLMQIAQEVQEEMQKGTEQMQAMLIVAERHKDTLKGVLGDSK